MRRIRLAARRFARTPGSKGPSSTPPSAGCAERVFGLHAQGRLKHGRYLPVFLIVLIIVLNVKLD